MRDFKFFTENRQPTAATEQPNPDASDNPIDKMPGNMPLTNRLDKMTPSASTYGRSKTGTRGSHI